MHQPARVGNSPSIFLRNEREIFIRYGLGGINVSFSGHAWSKRGHVRDRIDCLWGVISSMHADLSFVVSWLLQMGVPLKYFQAYNSILSSPNCTKDMIL